MTELHYHEDNGPFPRAEIRDAAKRERGKRALLPAAEAAVDDFDTVRENVRNGLNDGALSMIREAETRLRAVIADAKGEQVPS